MGEQIEARERAGREAVEEERRGWEQERETLERAQRRQVEALREQLLLVGGQLQQHTEVLQQHKQAGETLRAQLGVEQRDKAAAAWQARQAQKQLRSLQRKQVTGCWGRTCCRTSSRI